MLLTSSQRHRSNLRPQPPQRLRHRPPIKPRRLLPRQPHLQTLLRLRQRKHQTPSSHLRPPRRTMPPHPIQRQQQFNPHRRQPNPLPLRHRRILLRNCALVHGPHRHADSRQFHCPEMDRSSRRRIFPFDHRPLSYVAAGRGSRQESSGVRHAIVLGSRWAGVSEAD